MLKKKNLLMCFLFLTTISYSQNSIDSLFKNVEIIWNEGCAEKEELEIYYNKSENIIDVDRFKIQFQEDGLVILNTGVEQIHVTNGNVSGLIIELRQQEKKSIESSKKFNPRSELKELGNGQYEMSDGYLTDLFSARQVSSGYGVYKRKLIEISKVFRSGNSIKYMEKDFLSIDEFSNDLLSNLNDFKSIEDELQK